MKHTYGAATLKLNDKKLKLEYGLLYRTTFSCTNEIKSCGKGEIRSRGYWL